MVYSHRDVQQPAIFTYVNLGPKWTTTWLSYVTDSIAVNGTVDLYRRGGGDEPFTFDSGSAVSHPGQFSQSVITRRTDSGGNTSGFSRQLNDGSSEDFSLGMGKQFFMTSFADPQGNKVTITYDGQMRITKVTDALGQDTTVSYENPADPLKITKVTDPFGRSATFTYNANGQLASTTDVLGITSSYEYGANDFVQKLTTPYGSSTFTYGDASTDINLGSTRFLEATDALGRTSRVEFTQTETGFPNEDPTYPSGMGLYNYYLVYRNTFVWDPVQYQAAKGPTGFDYTKATLLHWLHTSDDTSTSRTLESTKSPLESRVWYTYPGQVQSITFGTNNDVTGVGRVLDDGSSQVESYAYNAMGKVTTATDAVGRQRTLGYASNGIDVTSIANTTAGANDVLLTATYNAQHEPLAITGANGQTTRFEYNAAGQLTKRTDAQGNATTYAYDDKGYLTTIQGPDPKATVALTYDPMGRIATATDVAGRTVTYAYDAADRITSATYPDGTNAKLTYQNLDLTSITDRLGQTTTLAYDAERELVSAADALGNVTKYGYSPASKLTSLTDPNGHVTTWSRDLEGRVTGKTFADNTSSTIAYENTTSRVHLATDAAGQTTTYGYALDGSMTSLVRAGAGGAESIAFTYDPAYPRPASMTDAIGLTSYAYMPVGALGANQIGSVTSPVAGAPPGTSDTVSYTYDELDRIVGRNVDGAADSTSFDALGRMTQVTNPLDTFTYAYADATERVAGVTSAHGPSMAFSYNDPIGDELVREIDATTSSASPLAKMTYAYNADDNVTSFTQEYLGKELTASSAGGGMIAPWTKGLGDEPKTSSKRDADSPRNHLGIFFTWCVPFLVALFLLLRREAKRRLGWAVPALLGVFLGGCGGCSSNDNGASSPNAGTTYLYDVANRVTAAQGQGAATYAYDPASNLTSITTSAASSAGGTALQSYSYTSTNAITSGTYDANGSPTSLGGATYTWDSANRLASATVGSTTSTFTYDGLSRLVRIVDKKDGSVVADRAFTWCGAERCAAHDNLQGGSPVVTRYFQQGIVDAGQSLYEVRDRLGSVRQLVDASGKVRAQYDYDPYGNRTKLAGDLDSEIGYAGYYHHAASGLDLTLYRAYDGSRGRWLNRDPIGESGGINLYEYTDGNPVNGVDPSGLLTLSFSPAGFGIGFIEGYIISAGFNAAGQALSSPSGCVDWGQANEAGLIGGVLGGLGGGVGIGGGAGEEPACPGGVCDGSSCFSGDTLVATEHGEEPIQNVAVGERVWSKNSDDGDLELRSVVRRYVTPNESLLDLEIVDDDGRDELLQATATHRFWVKGIGWTVAADLRTGDVLSLRSGKHAVFERTEKEVGRSTVYNLEVEGAHTYFVGNDEIWVHNGCGPNNPVPKTVARVVPGDVDYPTLGKPGDADVFVTDANAIAGLGAQEISDALTIPPSPVYTVYEFPTPSDGLASPVGRGNDGFVGGGLTQGGSPEYVIPNGAIPNDAVRRVVR